MLLALLGAPLSFVVGLADLSRLACDLFPGAPLGRELRVFVVPMLWLLATLLLSFYFRTRGEEHPPGSCGNCGYDLRHEHYKCPECGSTRGTLAERAGKLPPA